MVLEVVVAYRYASASDVHSVKYGSQRVGSGIRRWSAASVSLAGALQSCDDAPAERVDPGRGEQSSRGDRAS